VSLAEKIGAVRVAQRVHDLETKANRSRPAL